MTLREWDPVLQLIEKPVAEPTERPDRLHPAQKELPHFPVGSIAKTTSIAVTAFLK